MKIGIPKALLYERYGTLWQAYFKALGHQPVLSDDTTAQTLETGTSHVIDECCLPLKAYIGHVLSLKGRCDYILVPRFERLDKRNEFCMRFWGLPDIVRSTFPDLPLLSYNLQGRPGDQFLGFLQMAKVLGNHRHQAIPAYRSALKAQAAQDIINVKTQDSRLRQDAPKILIAGHPYLVRDPYIGGPILTMLENANVVSIFPDYCDTTACREASQELSSDLYWLMNKEILGAIPLLDSKIDGILFVTAFPCATDSLATELAIRRIKDIPFACILVDAQQGTAGLQTRIECFLEIIHNRRARNVS